MSLVMPECMLRVRAYDPKGFHREGLVDRELTASVKAFDMLLSVDELVVQVRDDSFFQSLESDARIRIVGGDIRPEHDHLSEGQ